MKRMLSFLDNHEIYDQSIQTNNPNETSLKDILQIRQEMFDFHHPSFLSQNITYYSRLDQTSSEEENLDLDQYFSFPLSTNKQQITSKSMEKQTNNHVLEKNQVYLTSCFSQNEERLYYSTTKNLSFLSEQFPSKLNFPQENHEFFKSQPSNESLFTIKQQDSCDKDEKTHMSFDIQSSNQDSGQEIKINQGKDPSKNGQHIIISNNPIHSDYDFESVKNQHQVTLVSIKDEETQKLSMAKNPQLLEQQEGTQIDLSNNQDVIKTQQKSGSLSQIKQNIHKSIMNAFKISIKQKDKIKSLLSTNFKGNIDNQIKQLQRYLRPRSFNHQILKYLMNHEIYSIIFKHFIFFEVQDWLEGSKISNKELASQVIDSLKNFMENKQLLDGLYCYKKKKRGDLF